MSSQFMEFPSAFRTFLILCLAEIMSTRATDSRYGSLKRARIQEDPSAIDTTDETYVSTQPTEAEEQARLPLAHELQDRA